MSQNAISFPCHALCFKPKKTSGQFTDAIKGLCQFHCFQIDFGTASSRQSSLQVKRMPPIKVHFRSNPTLLCTKSGIAVHIHNLWKSLKKSHFWWFPKILSRERWIFCFKENNSKSFYGGFGLKELKLFSASLWTCTFQIMEWHCHLAC